MGNTEGGITATAQRAQRLRGNRNGATDATAEENRNGATGAMEMTYPQRT
jgi:hypothetical protein